MTDNNTTKKIKELADSVTKAAEPYIELAKEKAEPALNEAKKKADPVIKEAKKKADPVIKEVMKKAEPATKAVKKQGAKAADVVKSASKDITEAAAKKNTKTDFYIQYKDYEIRTEDIGEKIREIYIAEGHKATDIKELQIYLKPEENTAYYVVNHKDTGKFTY